MSSPLRPLRPNYATIRGCGICRGFGVFGCETPLREAMAGLSQKLREAFERSGLTKRYIAQRIGVHESTVSLWLSGKRTPLVEHLKELAEVLRVDMADLWDGVEAIPAAPPVRALVDIANELTPVQQQALLALARSMLPH